MLLLFNNALWVTGGTSLRPLLAAAVVHTMAIYGTFFLQMGYDSGLLGLGDAGNFLAELIRLPEEANVNIPEAVFSPDSVLQPLGGSTADGKHWSLMSPDFPLQRKWLSDCAALQLP
jgi:hypothetical protein